jgi:RNA polymerase sigma-70 factor, ECF subfamily
VDFFDFNEGYLEQLRNRDFLTEQHFFNYFSQLLFIKLRSRVRSSQAVEDIQQETFLRVLKTLRTEAGIRSPEKFGAFVNSVCNNVLLEYYRSSSASISPDENSADQPDRTIDLDGMLTTKQTREHVRRILDQLPEKDRRLLRALFLEEMDKDEICREFGVDRDYLRVLLHRAKQNFKACYQGQPGVQSRAEH